MSNIALFWSFYVSFCTFCASLRLTRTVFSRPKTSAISAFSAVKNSCLCVLVAKTPRNLFTPLETCLLFLMGRNLLLIKDLRENKALYNCRDTFTDVMSALQIKLFMQNEPKFRKSQMNVNKVLTKAYEQLDTWSIGKNEPKTNPNEPKTNPNEPKFKKAKMNVTSYITKEYENKSNWALYENEPNSNPISEAKNDRGGDQQKDLENKG